MRLHHLSLLLLLFLPFLLPAQSAKKKKALYQSHLQAADSAFDGKDYVRAKSEYQQAAEMKPKETYPQERITECDKRAAVQNVEYKKLVHRGDSCFEQKNWDAAKTFYLQASSVKPAESYARDQAKTCNYNMVARNAMAQNYARAVKTADSCFAIKSWSCAKAQYETALSIRPNEAYPKAQLAICDQKMSNAVNAEQYAMMIEDADRRFDAGDYRGAKVKYQDALAAKPDDAYATKRIALCDEKLK